MCLYYINGPIAIYIINTNPVGCDVIKKQNNGNDETSMPPQSHHKTNVNTSSGVHLLASLSIPAQVIQGGEVQPVGLHQAAQILRRCRFLQPQPLNKTTSRQGENLAVRLTCDLPPKKSLCLILGEYVFCHAVQSTTYCTFACYYFTYRDNTA